MDSPIIPRDDKQAGTIVWPPAPIKTRPLGETVKFHLAEARFYTVSQTVNMVCATLYAITDLQHIDRETEYTAAIFTTVLTLFLCTSVVSAVFFLMYVYKAYLGVQELGADGLPYPPGWIVLWFFAPILNLYMPVRMLQTLWRASGVPKNPRDEFGWQQNSSSWLVSLWWCSYSAWILFTEFGTTLIRSDAESSGYTALSNLVPSFLSILMVQAIQKRQILSAQALGLEIYRGPDEFRQQFK